MSDGNAFAKEFIALLNRSGFPDEYAAVDILQQTHAIVTSLVYAVARQIGDRLTTAELASQGLKGGGGPHRLDLLLRYITDTDAKTLENTARLTAGT
jgi:hypothetical protein